jgi:tetratricopeptide (TPR) repeat protein
MKNREPNLLFSKQNGFSYMKKIRFLVLFFLCVGQSTSSVLYAQKSDDTASIKSSYGLYQSDVTSYTPKRISPLKIFTFPVMVIVSPIAFPTYYVHTKEPVLTQSFKNYWSWIHYRVPFQPDDSVKKWDAKPDYYARSLEEYKDVDTRESRRYVDEFEERYNQWHDDGSGQKPESDNDFEQSEIQDPPELSRAAKKIQTYQAKAEKAYAAEDFDKANKYYKKILKANADHAIARSMVTELDARTRDAKTAEQDLTEQKIKTDDISEFSSVVQEQVHMTQSDGDEEKKSQKDDKKSLWARFFGFFKKDDDSGNYQKKEKKQDPKSSQFVSAQDPTVERKKPVSSANEKNQFLTQTKIVPTKKQVKTIPPSIDPQSKSVLHQPLEENAKKRIAKILKKAERQYRKGNLDKALEYYFQVLQLDIRNEQAQKMTRTITDIQRSQAMEKTVQDAQ